MKKNGFTLVELSIVILIISLLIGGVMLGKSLIRNSQLQAAIAERQQYTGAMNAFREKYLALPGDFAGATALWGTVNLTGSSCTAGTSNTPSFTFNGNANGYIDAVGGTLPCEQFRGWQHLNNAGLLSVKVDGLMTATYNKTPGTNIPASKLKGAGWAMTFVAQASTDAVKITNDVPYNHVLWLGGLNTNTTTNLTSPVLTPIEALTMDQKLDDGAANSGQIVAENDAGTCLNGTPQYDVTKTTQLCSLVFKTGF